MGKLKEIFKIVNESACDSTTHSIPHIFKRENVCLKLFWLACFLTSATVCAYTVFNAITNYFHFETVTKVDTILEMPTQFPTVSICNLNPFMKQPGFEFSRAYFHANNVTDINYFLSDTFSNSIVMLRYAIGANLQSSTITDEMRKQIGLNINDMLLLCSYNQNPCFAQEFDWYFDTLYGYVDG